eukprot:1758449-Pleurochrysis_carterae.AAC.2
MSCASRAHLERISCVSRAHLGSICAHLVRVVDGREARESAPVDVDFERTVPDDENVEAQVELLAADEEGVGDVAGG